MSRDRISTGDGVRMEWFSADTRPLPECWQCSWAFMHGYRAPIGGGWSLYCVPCAEAISVPVGAGDAACSECAATDGRCGCLAPLTETYRCQCGAVCEGSGAGVGDQCQACYEGREPAPTYEVQAVRLDRDATPALVVWCTDDQAESFGVYERTSLARCVADCPTRADAERIAAALRGAL